MVEHERLSLRNLIGGGAIERFDDTLEQVIENIRDVNTHPTAARKITLTVTFKPTDDERDFGNVTIDCKPTLAPPISVQTQAYFGHDGKRFLAIENNPKQGNLFRQDPDDPTKVIPMQKEVENNVT